MIQSNVLLSYFDNAGIVVKLVMLTLLAASVLSWTIILQRSFFLAAIKRNIKAFNARFLSTENLVNLYKEIKNQPLLLMGVTAIFTSGFNTYIQNQNQKQKHNKQDAIDTAKKAMTITQAKEIDKLEHNLSILATIGSTSPYIGLFGTVWGIMTAFHALGNVQQATIAMVAPGISEALIATAMGLFAAIPAVIAYNRFVNQVQRIDKQYELFQEELSLRLTKTSVKAKNESEKS